MKAVCLMDYHRKDFLLINAILDNFYIKYNIKYFKYSGETSDNYYFSWTQLKLSIY